jgi:hypothetical protein
MGPESMNKSLEDSDQASPRHETVDERSAATSDFVFNQTMLRVKDARQGGPETSAFARCKLEALKTQRRGSGGSRQTSRGRALAPTEKTAIVRVNLPPRSSVCLLQLSRQ